MSAWSARGLALEREFCDIARSLGGDVASRVAGGRALERSHAAYHGGPQAWDLVPKMIDPGTFELLRDAAETMYAIMAATVRRCIADPPFCERFCLPASFHDLLALPAHYPQAVPLARVDLFLNEETGDYWFCEANTDGSFGFTVADEVTAAIQGSETYRRFAARHPDVRAFDLRPGWMRALEEVYAAWGAPAPRLHPRVPELALVDYPESVEMAEVEDFIERFRAVGVRARFADVRGLRIVDRDGSRRLADGEGPVSCAWMRAVTGELLEKPCPGVDALVQAARGNLACLVGGFRTWPVAMKTFFAVLHDPDAGAFLSPDQVAFVKRHVPETHRLAPTADLAPYRDRERWIAKPASGYNARGVVAGVDVGAREWDRALSELAREGGVVQRYAPQFAVSAIPGNQPMSGGDPLDFRPARTMMGLFLFNGRFSGVYSRCGYHAVIGEAQGRLNQGCLIVGE